MNTLSWIVGSSLAMSAIALVGLMSIALDALQLKKLLLPLVACWLTAARLRRCACSGDQAIMTFLGCCELSSRKVFLRARSAAVGCTTPLASVARDTSVCSPGVASSQR